MLTPLQQRKLTRYFEVLDYDDDGFLERADFEEIARNLSALRGWTEDSPQYEDMAMRVLEIWENTHRFGDTDRDDRISLAEWLRHEERVLASPALMTSYTLAVAGTIFDIVDEDGDGVISPREFGNFYHAFRVAGGAAIAAASFRRMDQNGDGRISRTEMLSRVEEFHLSNDANAPGNWLFGPY